MTPPDPPRYGLHDPHPAVGGLLGEHRTGQLSRREFLTRATALGLTAFAARAMIDGRPAQAQDRAASVQGGTLRIQMSVMAQKDPRLWDFTQMSNALSGLLEHLVEVQRDGTLTGVLLEGWDANDDATEYLLRLRPGVRWNTGAAFTAEDVAANFAGWCDRSVPGNSMASRLAPLIDDSTGRAADGAIEVLDDLTVRLRLKEPDITLLPGITDYPAAIQHRDLIGTDPLSHGVGTGAYRIADFATGSHAVLERNPDHVAWRPALLDRVEFVDLGPDPAGWLAAAQEGAIDMLFDTVGEFVAVFDTLGWRKSAIDTAATVVIRPNQTARVGGRTPYADRRVRRALAMAVDNNVLLELGYSGYGLVAENHHVAPLHPEYAPLPPIRTDPREARAMMETAGMLDFEHEVISIDDDWQRDTADACAAQLRDAGFRVTRRILAGDEYWSGWAEYPLSTTNWNARELGVQVLALAYRSGEAWNETGFSNAEFDGLLAQAMGLPSADERRSLMARMEAILQDEGVIIQPYWRTLFRHYRDGVVGAERDQKDMIDIHKLGLSV